MRVMIAFFALSITSPAIAQTDLTGIWFGGLSDGRGQVALSPEFVDDMVKVELDFRNWAQDGFGKCIFYGRVDAAGTAELILNTGAGEPDRIAPAARRCKQTGQVREVSRRPSRALPPFHPPRPLSWMRSSAPLIRPNMRP